MLPPRRSALKASIAIVTFAAVAAVAGIAYYFVLMPTGRFPHPRIVTVGKGESLHVVAERLARAGVVRSTAALVLWAELSGQSRSIKPGEYSFAGGERISGVLRRLVDGDYMVVLVTIPEGLTVRQIAERLERAGLVCQSEFARAAREGPLVRALGLGPFGAEGYLFPATYALAPDANSDQILFRMLQRFYEVLTPAIEQRLFVLGLDARQMLTLASMIEKEARVPGERRIIASVFYNRLKLGMPLQSDPTAQYNPAGVTEPAAIAVHQRSLFNTYDFVGLPPAPIANPGISSIMAALYPAHTDYLYFVARGDGTHIFSRTLKEHDRAIALLRQEHDQMTTRANVRTPSESRVK